MKFASPLKHGTIGNSGNRGQDYRLPMRFTQALQVQTKAKQSLVKILPSWLQLPAMASFNALADPTSATNKSWVRSHFMTILHTSLVCIFNGTVDQFNGGQSVLPQNKENPRKTGGWGGGRGWD